MLQWTKEECVKHDKVHRVYKDIQRRRASGKVLRGKAFEISNNPTLDGYQHGIGSMVYKFLDKKFRDTTRNGTAIFNAFSDTIPKNKQIAK